MLIFYNVHPTTAEVRLEVNPSHPIARNLLPADAQVPARLMRSDASFEVNMPDARGVYLDGAGRCIPSARPLKCPPAPVRPFAGRSGGTRAGGTNVVTRPTVVCEPGQRAQRHEGE